jgi:hypothetical protein
MADLINPLAVHLLPGGVDDRGQPIRDGNRQCLQRRPDGLPGQLQPVQAADTPQHVRGVGALPGAGRHQAQPSQPVQQQIQDLQLQASRHQPGSELAQHRKVKALILQGQAQAVLPVQPAPHPSAACRSVRFPVNCSTVTIVSCAGEIPGFPRAP